MNAKRIRDYGAKVLETAGNAPDDAVFLDSLGGYIVEGEKCAALLLLDALGWRVPDWVVLPGDMLRLARALSRGFDEARALGLIERSPQVAVVGIDVVVEDADIRSAKAVIGRDGIACETSLRSIGRRHPRVARRRRSPKKGRRRGSPHLTRVRTAC